MAKLYYKDPVTGEYKPFGGGGGGTGAPGKSAYEYAQDGGYTGTEAEFARKLAAEYVPVNEITLGVHTDGLVYVFVNGAPVGNGVELTVSSDLYGYVDSENNVVVKGNLADGTYSVKYEMEDGSTVAIGDLVLDSNVYSSVTNNLTNCVTDNSATQTAQGESYSATITANSGYTLSSVAVTMGGTDVTASVVSGGSINITEVTGDIVITAEAVEVQANYTNLADPTSADWMAGYRLNSSGVAVAADGVTVTNFIAVNDGDVVRIKGIDLTVYNSVPYLEDKTVHTSFGVSKLSSQEGLSANNVTVTTTGAEFTVVDGLSTTSSTSPVKYWRFSGVLNGTADDVIITINETIE